MFTYGLSLVADETGNCINYQSIVLRDKVCHNATVELTVF